MQARIVARSLSPGRPGQRIACLSRTGFGHASCWNTPPGARLRPTRSYMVSRLGIHHAVLRQIGPGMRGHGEGPRASFVRRS